MTPLRQLVSLARPRGAIYVLLLPLAGYGYAHWEHRLALTAPRDIAVVVLAWLCLHAGTMWLNANLDRDSGAVLFGEATTVPPSTAVAGYGALLASVVMAATAGWHAAFTSLVCATLAVAYSHPRLALKGHPLMGPAINVLGYGVLSPLTGFWVVGVSPTPRSYVLWPLFATFILSLYFVAQWFQGAEDRLRAYRTLVVTHGPRAAVGAARLAWGLGCLGVAAMALGGWLPRVSLAALVWALPLPYAKEADRPTEADALRCTRRALAYGVTLLALVWGDHLTDAHRLGSVTFDQMGVAAKTSTRTTPMLSLPP